MARKISRTLILEGELVADTPLHIGGADTGHTTDMPLAVDGLGHYYLPGTSIAGALRAWEQADEEDDIWGFAGKDEKRAHASFLIIDDAPVDTAPAAELWHGVGIDRRTGGAASGIKFDRQVLPQGTKFKFRIAREVGAGETALEGARQQMGKLLIALENGWIPFGGGVTRGFGRLRLEQAIGKEIDWSSKDGILGWLKDARPDAATAGYWRTSAEPFAPASGQIEILIHWQPKGPLMSKAARDGIAVDALPFVSRNRAGKDALTLPGSAIKGALRQQAERIVRTVLNRDVDVSAPHFDQVDVPLVRELFGSARPADKQGKKSLAVRGLLAVDTCYAELALSTTDWDALDTDADTWRTTQQPLYKSDHVAIDRWTGGASGGALFNTVEPDKSVQWEPIRLRFACRRETNIAALALLWLTLRDLATGRIPLGFGVNRGYGDLAVSRIELSGLSALGHTQDVLNTDPARIDQSPLIDLLKPAWTAWLAEQHQPTKEAA